jgi:hypothetical protein
VPEGRMRATPILPQQLIREMLAPLAILGGLYAGWKPAVQSPALAL